MTMEAPSGFWENNSAGNRELAKNNMNACLLQFNTKAELDTILNKIGMMAYANDLRVFFRYNGTNLAPLQLFQIGLDSAKPSGTTSNNGRIYFATDTSQLYAIIDGTRYVVGTSTALSNASPVAVTAGATGDDGSGTAASKANHVHPTTTGAPVAVTAGATAADGSSTQFVRRDHRHSTTVGSPSAITAGGSAATGSSNQFVRRDHVHAASVADPVRITVNHTNAGGSATTFSRSDHRHSLTSSAPVAVGTANASGNSTNVARANHVHAQQTNVRVILIGTDEDAPTSGWANGDLYFQREA